MGAAQRRRGERGSGMSERMRTGGRNALNAMVRVAGNPIVAIAVFALGVAAAVAMRRQGVDAAWPYAYAHGLWHGEPIFSQHWRDVDLPRLTGLHSDFGF